MFGAKGDEKVTFKNKKEYDSIMQKVLEAIEEGGDMQDVEKSLDKILELYPSSTKIII